MKNEMSKTQEGLRTLTSFEPGIRQALQLRPRRGVIRA